MSYLSRHRKAFESWFCTYRNWNLWHSGLWQSSSNNSTVQEVINFTWCFHGVHIWVLCVMSDWFSDSRPSEVYTAEQTNVLWCTVGYSSHAAEAKRAKRSNSSLWWNIFSLKSAVWASFWIEVILFGRSLSTNSGELLLLKIQPVQPTDTLLSVGFCLSFFPSHTFVLPALAPVQKLPPSTSTKSPAACWASAGSSSLQPYRAAQATSRQSTARYTPPLPPPRQLPLHRRPRPPCLTRWLSPHRATPLNWPRATPRINTTACSSRRACLSTSAKVSGQTQRFRFVPAQTVDATNHWLIVHFCGLLLCDWWISCMHRVTRLFVWVWQHQLSLSCLLDVVSGGVSQISLPAQIHTDTQGNCYHGNRLCDARPRLSSLVLACVAAIACLHTQFVVCRSSVCVN